MKMSLRRLLQLATVSLAGMGMAACAEEVTSPKVSLTTISPNLVCNAQRVDDADAVVTLTGDGFTPMPTNVLAEPTILILPEIEIKKTQDLTGTAAGGSDTVFPGKPDETLSNNVFWKDKTTMSIRISSADPAVVLDPGLYDVTVTQPDKKKTQTVEQGLAVVDPPKIDSVDPVPQARCTAQGAQDMIVHGSNFLVVGAAKPKVTMTMVDGGTGTTMDLSADQVTPSDCATIPGTFAGGQVQLCDTLTLSLSDLNPTVGAYTVTVTSPAPADCESVESPVVYIAPPPFVDNIDPPAICVDQADQTITVNGGNFANVIAGTAGIPTVRITSNDGTTSKEYTPTVSACAVPDGLDQAFGLELCATMQFTVPMNDLPVGDYTLTIINPDPVGCQSEEVIDLTVNAPPEVTGVAPATVCSGGSILQVTGNYFQPGADAILSCAGTTVPSTGVEFVDSNTLNVTFGPGITAGEVCDVIVSNPDSCADNPPHQTVTGTEGPILFNVDPNVAYSGIDTRVNLYVTALDGTFTVQMWPDGDGSAPVTLDAQLAPGKTTVIQAIIPSGTAAGSYTLSVNDQSGCLASLATAVTVTDTTIDETGSTVTPPFGQDSDSTAITIGLASDPGTTGVPRAFLNPAGTSTDPAIQLRSVTVVDPTTLTAVVPANTPAGSYDLVIVWPDGSVVVLSGAYTSISAAPPVVDNVNPQSINAQSGQIVTLSGTGFNGSTVSVVCLQPGGNQVTAATTEQTEVCAAGSCTQQATIDASAVAQGSACVVRATNSDGSYGDFSAVAVTNSSLNLAVTTPTVGPDLNTGRRALVSEGIRASSAARYVYAIGGDDGAVANAMASAEFAAVDLFGSLNPWTNSAESMTSARAFADSTAIGRYIYVAGGNDGSGTVATAERALVLSPDEIPDIANIDLCLSGGSADCFGVAGLADGLDAGVYSYRVAALIDPTDPVNLGGETLASDPIILRLRDIQGRKVAVSIDWSAPVDSAGTELSGITGYRIYRTPLDGQPGSDEVLLAEVGAGTLNYIDDGTDTLGTQKPLPVGSTSAWQALPDMGEARQGLGVVAAMDPGDATIWYVYAMLGQSGGTPSGSYEFLPITLQTNGRQTAAASWTVGTEASGTPRFNQGTWRLDDSVSGVTAGTTYIYLGSGNTAAATTSGVVEYTTVSAGGQLTAFDDAGVSDLTGNGIRDGYGAVPVGSATTAKLFMFGGRQSGGGAPQTSAYGGATPSGGAVFPDVAFNAEGGFAMSTGRAFLGCTVQSANVFMIGGTSNGTNALASTEYVVW